MTYYSSVNYLDTVDSTNSFLRRETKSDRTIVYTFNQTDGRGRENRQWRDINGKNLALSVIFKAELNEVPLWRIALLSLPLIELFHQMKMKNVWIKWPNDIFVENKKIAGILAESITVDGQIQQIIVGIGVNINSAFDELSRIEKPATSVFCETGIMQDMDQFAKRYIELLSKSINAAYSAEAIREKWLSASGIIGKSFEWISPQGPVTGCAIDVGSDGILHLDTVLGIVDVIAGDLNIKDSRVK
jgi:BirA family transcriptional regulator, biotin operon repressor / biotin---[acetyl-CoA-carboxylase] ligase